MGSFKLTAGCGMKKRKITLGTATLIGWDRNKYSDWGGNAGLGENFCGMPD